MSTFRYILFVLFHYTKNRIKSNSRPALYGERAQCSLYPFPNTMQFRFNSSLNELV